MIQLKSFANNDYLVSCLSRSIFWPGTLSADFIRLKLGNFGVKHSMQIYVLNINYKNSLFKNFNLVG